MSKTETIKLEKYKASTLKNARITDLTISEFGEVIIKNIVGQTKTFHIDANIGNSDNVFDYSADYILCEFQDDIDINIKKY